MLPAGTNSYVLFTLDKLIYKMVQQTQATLQDLSLTPCAGTNSYVLFTLDKLIYKMVKQTQAIVQDDLAMKLVDLHAYEASRSISTADAVHKANARVLLSDEPVYRFQIRAATSMAIQLQEFDGSDVQPGAHSSMIYWPTCVLCTSLSSGGVLQDSSTHPEWQT